VLRGSQVGMEILTSTSAVHHARGVACSPCDHSGKPARSGPARRITSAFLPMRSQQEKMHRGDLMGIDVVVADDLCLSRYALTALLEQCEGIQVVASVDSNLCALEFAQAHRPDIVIISFDGADNGVIQIAEKIASLPGCRSLLLVTAFTRSVVRQAFISGIHGMVQRSVSPDRFFEAIYRVYEGEKVFDTELTVAALGNEGCPLTLRQLSVLECLSRGDTVAEIAARLHLSEGTVRNYLSSAVAKLRARNRIDALGMARDAHWI
jgi:two-component system, NarL family, response regulator DesR